MVANNALLFLHFIGKSGCKLVPGPKHGYGMSCVFDTLVEVRQPYRLLEEEVFGIVKLSD